jgi:hypothetical protein
MRPARPWILLLACASWPLAHAQAIYRCGDSYSQQPCRGGTQVAPAAAPPSAADRSQAAAAAARDARLAESMQKERLRLEAQASSAAVILPAEPSPEPAPHQWPEKAGTRKLDMFTASVPGSRQRKTKAAASKAAAGQTKHTGSTGKGSSGATGRAVQPTAVNTAKAAGG